jgi:Trm5-related predicted tRNA methylase
MRLKKLINRYLAKKEFYKSLKKQKQIENSQREKIQISTIHSCFLQRLDLRNTPKNFYRNRVASSIINNAPRVVFDCRFMNMHTRQESLRSMFRQLTEIIVFNRASFEPFQIYFCNYSTETEFHAKYGKLLGYDENLIFETSRDYTDVFPREELIYLTSDATRSMKKYDSNKVYIIGNIVDNDREKFKFATIEQAKKDQVAFERFSGDIVK